MSDSTPNPPPDVRMRGFRARADVRDVLRLLDARQISLSAETLALADAANRVLAADVVADVAVPGFDRAAMDGYALRSADTPCPVGLHIVGESLPGRAFAHAVAPGQAVRIMTGAPVPSGADAILQVELAQVENDRLNITSPVAPGRHIGRRGEDIAIGTRVLAAGRRLRPQDLGVLASIGVSSLSVYRAPRVAVLITGNELLPPGARPEGQRIVDSNSVMLAALIRRDGGVVVQSPILPDDRATIRQALLSADAEVILISGGSSVGQEDHAPQVLASEGELLVHGVALRPAGPAGVGFLGGRPVFLLPGNPVSCLCAYDLFAGPTIRRLGGRSPELPYTTLHLSLATAIHSVEGRMDYVRVLVREGQVEPLALTGASMLSTTTNADGFVLVPHERPVLPANEIVTVYCYEPRGVT